MDVLTVIFELIVLLIYGWRLLVIRGRDLMELLSSTLFGFTLEYMNILINNNYHYSKNFFLQIGKPPLNVPVAVALGWGLIITSCLSLTDQLGVANKPFFDAILALSIDLSMDVVAIRIEGGFWKWQVPLVDYPTEQGFFGVPWGNLTSWIYVVFIYSIAIRYSRKHIPEGKKLVAYFLLAPIIAYLPLFLLIIGSIAFYFLLGLRALVNPVIYQLLPIMVCLLVALHSLSKVKLHFNPCLETLPVFTGFHIYFIGVYLYLDLQSSIPVILPLELTMFVLSLLLHLFSVEER